MQRCRRFTRWLQQRRSTGVVGLLFLGLEQPWTLQGEVKLALFPLMSVADNIYLFRNSLRPYVDYMQDPANGFQSVTLFLSDGMEYSVRVA